MALSLTLTLTPSPVTADLAVGETLQLHATPANGVKWKSNNCTCVSVSKTGLATALSAGVAIITATRGNLSASVTITVTVPGPYVPPELPTAVLVLDTATDYTSVVIVNTAGSESANGSLLTGTIAWGDGQTSVWPGQSANLYEHLYAGPGTYLIVLTVVDGSGNIATASITVLLPPHQPPIARLALTTNAPAGSPITVSTVGSTDTDGSLVSYSLAWGDSQTSSQSTIPPVSLQHTYAASGTYTLTLTVTDNDGLTGIATISVTIQAAPPPPTPPVAALAYLSGGTLGQPYIVTTTGTTSPVDSYTLNWGDATIDGASTNVPAQLSHTYASAGSFSVTLTVLDSLGRAGTATIIATIAVVPPTPDPPTAVLTYVSGQYTTQPYTLSTVGTGDTDGSLVSGSITWGDGTAPTTWGPTLPAQLSHVYGAAGTYTATLTVVDDDGLSGVATRTIVISAVPVVNQPPTAVLTRTQGIYAGDTFRLSTAGSGDADGQLVSGSLNWGDGSALVTWTGVPAATYDHVYGSVSGPIYYISTTGSDANPGTLASPKLTMVAGLALLTAAGGTLYIRGGTYSSQRIFEGDFPASGTSWTNKILVAGYPGETVTMNISGGGDNLVRFANGSRTYIEIADVILDGTGGVGAPAGGTLVYTASTSSRIRLTRVTVRNCTGSGLLIEGADHELLNLNVHGNGTYAGYLISNGLYISGDRVLVDGGTYWNNETGGIRTGDSSASATGDTCVIRNARIYQNGAGYGLNGASISSAGGSGLFLGDNDHQAYNNRVYGNYAGVIVFGLSSKTAARNLIYNNTMYNNSPGAGVETMALASATEIKNNIIYANASTIVNGGSGTAQSNNLTANPLFTNAGSGDFTVQAGSPAIDAGTTLAMVTTDCAGGPRPQGSAYDIGAHER